MRFNRVWLLLAAVLNVSLAARADLASILTNVPPAARSIPRRPSIILLVADGVGYGDLSCYGQTMFQTPNLDRLAAEGMRLTNYDAAATASAPAWAALLLGRDARDVAQRPDMTVPLAAGDVTVAQILNQNDYHTGWIGEWDLGDENSSGAPWKKGFDEFAGYFDPADAANFYADYVWRYAPASLRGQDHPDFVGKEMIYVNTGGRQGQYVPDLLATAALNFIKNNQPDRFNQFRPFFLVLNYPLPGAGNGIVPSDAPYSEEPWPQVQKTKAAMLGRLDSFAGQLREQLQKLHLTNNVAVFFTSAAGPQTNGGVDPRFFHSRLASDPLRVPLIVHWPGTVPAGRVSGVPATAANFLPTAEAIAFIPTNEIWGVSLLPTLTGRTHRASALKP